jgi:hypothetical protein
MCSFITEFRRLDKYFCYIDKLLKYNLSKMDGRLLQHFTAICPINLEVVVV